MDSPLFQARLTLSAEADRPRIIANWRPTLSQGLGRMQYGIAFAEGPQQGMPGREFACSFRFLAWPDPGCRDFASGTEFVLHEGSTVVARGRITRIVGHAGPD